MIHDRYRRLQVRQDRAAVRVNQAEVGFEPTLNGPAFVGAVCANPKVPLATNAYYSANPASIVGPEGEGLPGTVTVDTSRIILVYVIGAIAPVAGDLLICRFIGNRWVAERMAAHKPIIISIPGCPCSSLPSTLHMTSSKPNSNLGMFQNATIAYGPTPPAYAALGLGASSFLSIGSYPDSTTGDMFQYFFTCYNGYYILTRVYGVSSYGSPYLDIIRFRWLIGLAGNTCSPFLLSNGQVYQGGDRTANVTISS